MEYWVICLLFGSIMWSRVPSCLSTDCLWGHFTAVLGKNGWRECLQCGRGEETWGWVGDGGSSNTVPCVPGQLLPSWPARAHPSSGKGWPWALLETLPCSPGFVLLGSNGLHICCSHLPSCSPSRLFWMLLNNLTTQDCLFGDHLTVCGLKLLT